MRVLVESLEDPASVNMADRLRELAEWEELGLFNGRRVLGYEDLRLVTIEGLHINSENVDRRLPPSLADPDVLVFLSRHASESGTPTLSVHPIGNFADAPYGGEEGRVVASNPAWMVGLFKELLKRDPEGYEVTYEATHHGPFVEVPTLFYELGSDEAAWRDEDAARVLVEALLEAGPVQQRPVLWVGGGHYCPQVNDAVRAGSIAPGHIIPGWAAKASIEDSALKEALAAIPGCEGYVLQPGATSEETKLAERLDAWGIERIEVDA